MSTLMSTSVAAPTVSRVPTEDIWLIGTHAGDREIHVEPYFESHKFTRFLSDPLGRDINTRRILTADDLNRIRNISPMAVAIQILLSCGYAMVLFGLVLEKAIEVVSSDSDSKCWIGTVDELITHWKKVIYGHTRPSRSSVVHHYNQYTQLCKAT